jgi:hypothetical protein
MPKTRNIKRATPKSLCLDELVEASINVAIHSP